MRREGGVKERMRTERNGRVTGASEGEQASHSDSQAAPEMQNSSGLGCNQAPPSPEHLSADWFSLDPARAGQLVAELGPPPEVRSERISALQAAIADGTYKISPEQMAEAILAEQQVRTKTAA